MEVTFNSEEINEVFETGLHALGLVNIDPDSIKVTIKSIRDGAGGSTATVSFDRSKEITVNDGIPVNSITATATEPADKLECSEPDLSPTDNPDLGEPSSGLFGN